MPRGYSEYEPLKRALQLDFSAPSKPPIRQVGGDGWSSRNIPLILGARMLLMSYAKANGGELRFWLGWFGEYLRRNHEGFQFGEDFSRIYGCWHYQPVLVAELVARAAGGMPGVQSEAVDWLRAFFGYLVLCSNGKRPRKILEHGNVSEPEPVYGDGPEIKGAGFSVAWAGKRSWSRGDDPKSPIPDRTGPYGSLDQCGIQELLGFLCGEKIPEQREVVETYRALDRIAAKAGVTPAWRPSADEIETARRAMAGDVGSLLAVVSWVSDWPLHIPCTILRTVENGVVVFFEELGKGSTSGLTCCSILPSGQTVYVCANDGRRTDYAKALKGLLIERGSERFAVSINEDRRVEAKVASGQLKFRVRVGPLTIEAETFGDPKPPEPPVKPPAGEDRPTWWQRFKAWLKRAF